MAKRPVFIPNEKGSPFVQEEMVEFEWFPGHSIQQKQRSITSMHESAKSVYGLTQILEISSKSDSPSGNALSAFKLMLDDPAVGYPVSVEAAFQGSKVFEDGGPYSDLFIKSAREARKDPRLTESGRLKFFEFGGKCWKLEPRTAFYDWLYLCALQQQPDLAQQLFEYSGFTDIEFNPQKSINCQARSAALYVALTQRGLLNEALETPERYLQIVSSQEG